MNFINIRVTGNSTNFPDNVSVAIPQTDVAELDVAVKLIQIARVVHQVTRCQREEEEQARAFHTFANNHSASVNQFTFQRPWRAA